jgi:hypothetical protein
MAVTIQKRAARIYREYTAGPFHDTPFQPNRQLSSSHGFAPEPPTRPTNRVSRQLSTHRMPRINAGTWQMSRKGLPHLGVSDPSHTTFSTTASQHGCQAMVSSLKPPEATRVFVSGQEPGRCWQLSTNV